MAIGYATRRETAEKVVAEIRSLGRKSICGPCDAANQEQIDTLVSDARRELGAIDLFAHCGAVSNIAPHTELTYERWFETIDANLNGTFRVVFAVKDEMIRRGFGRIVLISSVAALRPRALQIHYASSKAGVIALARCCSDAFAPHGVSQLHRSRSDRNRDGPRAQRRANCPDKKRDAARTARPAGGNRRAGLLSPERTLELYDGTRRGLIGRPSDAA